VIKTENINNKYGRYRNGQIIYRFLALVYQKNLVLFARKMYNHRIEKRRNEPMSLEAELMTTAEAAEIWGISTRRVQVLCDKGKVMGAVRMNRTWIIPRGTVKPIDGRTKLAKSKTNYCEVKA
jgi:hypothetical protein